MVLFTPYHLLSKCALGEGKFLDARKYATAAFSLAEKHPEVKAGRTEALSQLVEVAYAQKDFESEENYLKQLLQSDTKDHHSYIYRLLAICYQNLKRPDEQLKMLKTSVALDQASGAKDFLLGSMRDLATYYAIKGNSDEALLVLLPSREVYVQSVKDASCKEQLAANLSFEGELYNRKNNYVAAVKGLSESADLYRGLGLQHIVSYKSCLQSLISICEKSGDSKKLAEFKTRLESISNPSSNPKQN